MPPGSSDVGLFLEMGPGRNQKLSTERAFFNRGEGQNFSFTTKILQGFSSVSCSLG